MFSKPDAICMIKHFTVEATNMASYESRHLGLRGVLKGCNLGSHALSIGYYPIHSDCFSGKPNNLLMHRMD